MSGITDSYMRKPQVRAVTGLSDTTIWRLERANKFPQRRKLSSNATGWLLSEVQEWLRSRPSTKMGDK